MHHDTIALATDDGRLPCHRFHPEGAGPWPAVVLYLDVFGVRPALFAIAERITRAGYFVLLPDLFYRLGPIEPVEPQKIYADEAAKAAWFGSHLGTATAANAMRDTRVLLDFLGAQQAVCQPSFAAVGYCMGGRLALSAAGTFPGRIRAVASYHGSRLATDAPDSPHRLAPKVKARVYVAGAIEDSGFPDEQKARLAAALASAGVEHQIETYPARHGWVPTDMPAHDPAAAERHFETLFALLDGAFARERPTDQRR